ncbi:MAG: phosphorylase [Leptolyngbyaceae cyanobacterium MO_188.B28]|nr:phosphorylase [Leptolyngbyaceae cyanobacterium MO_188.B28]
MPNPKTNGQSSIILEPGMLWLSITQRTQHALQCGALKSIETEHEFVEHDGVQFLVRILANLVRKEQIKQLQAQKQAVSNKEFNPFLPYETDLFVIDLSDTHLCLLNKFNVVDHHILMITRAFEAQDTWLTLNDFEALGVCLAEVDGMAFYNGGKIAGASQRHKHLQLVPLPMTPMGARIPIEPLIESAQFNGGVGDNPELPFKHAIARLDTIWRNTPQEIAEAMLEIYRTLLQAVGFHDPVGHYEGQQSHPYNLIATRQWMMIVPRSQESYHNISVNSLGFAGSLLVRNSEQMQLLKALGPMNLLKQVAL